MFQMQAPGQTSQRPRCYGENLRLRSIFLRELSLADVLSRRLKLKKRMLLDASCILLAWLAYPRRDPTRPLCLPNDLLAKCNTTSTCERRVSAPHVGGVTALEPEIWEMGQSRGLYDHLLAETKSWRDSEEALLSLI